MLALLLTALFPADPVPLDPTTGKMAIGQMGTLPRFYTYRVYRFNPPGNPPSPMDTGYAEIDVLDEKGAIVGTILTKGNEQLKDAKGGMFIKMPGTQSGGHLRDRSDSLGNEPTYAGALSPPS
jgi:hypothetical protein